MTGTPARASRADVERLVRQAVYARRPGPTRTTPPPNPLVVNVRARHCHLSQEVVDALFGAGHQLQPLQPLSRDGGFVAQETVTIVGPRQRVISGLRILGPCRPHTQVELATSDGLALGLDLPLRTSGDLEQAADATLIGPAGLREVRRAVIRPARHVHMGPDDAARFGVRSGDLMKLRIGGAAAATLDRVVVRVQPGWTLEVHLDTDDANACNLQADTECELVR